MRRYFVLLVLLIHSSLIFAANNDFDTKMQNHLSSHYEKYKGKEYFSGAELSVYLPKKPIKTFYVGHESHDANSKPISGSTLFQIGSITKSFTAAIILQLETENKLKLSDPIEKWLPDYNKWSGISIESLLNMTSNLPNYSDAPLWNAAVYQNPERFWTEQELISFVYPNDTHIPPLKVGYFYSNTGYILTSMLIEIATHHTFQREIENRILKPLKLNNTYYPVPSIDRTISDRVADGYNFNQYDNPAFVGKNVKSVNLSWAGAAGALISNSEDIIKWVNALFVEKALLNNSQKSKLMKLISTTSGKHIASISKSDPRGFGLGVTEAYSEDLGRYWFYEGETLGYRAVYLYVPCNGIVISSIFNSATNSENDHVGELIKSVYATLLKSFPKMRCQS